MFLSLESMKTDMGFLSVSLRDLIADLCGSESHSLNQTCSSEWLYSKLYFRYRKLPFKTATELGLKRSK